MGVLRHSQHAELQPGIITHIKHAVRIYIQASPTNHILKSSSTITTTKINIFLILFQLIVAFTSFVFVPSVLGYPRENCSKICEYIHI